MERTLLTMATELIARVAADAIGMQPEGERSAALGRATTAARTAIRLIEAGHASAGRAMLIEASEQYLAANRYHPRRESIEQAIEAELSRRSAAASSAGERSAAS